MPSYTQVYNILPHSPVVGSLQTAHKNTLFPILWEDETNVQECLHIVKWGVQRVASEPPQAPGYYTSPFYGDWPTRRFIGQSYATYLYLLLVRDDLELPYVW